MLSRGHVWAVSLLGLVACTPTFDWRESRPEGSGVKMLFPCRPDRHERSVRLAGADALLRMHSCSAGRAVFSLSFADATEPNRVAAVLAQWRGSGEGNIGGTSTEQPLVVAGATPNPRSVLLRMEGHLPDGRRVVEQAAFFVRGLRCYEAAVIGESLPADVAETFFAGITLLP